LTDHYRVIEVFEPIQRDVLSVGDAEPQFLVTNLSLGITKSSACSASHQPTTACDPPRKPEEIRTTTCGT